MAVEAKRGCGYRKVGGLYLVAEGFGSPCCKMPLELTICPCCGNGIKQTRGWTWIDAGKMFRAGGCEADPLARATCPVVNPALMGKVGLLWVGEKFYKRPVDFANEAAAMGISRRLTAVPREFKAGETWVLFAHPKAIQKPRTIAEPSGETAGAWVVQRADGKEEAEGVIGFPTREEADRRAAELDLSDPVYVPGVIRIVRPAGFELIVKQSQVDQLAADRAAWAATAGLPAEQQEAAKTELMRKFERDAARGIKWVPVPDNDPDHQGTVYDEEKEEPAAA